MDRWNCEATNMTCIFPKHLGRTVRKHLDQLKARHQEARHQEDSSPGHPPPVTPIVSEQQDNFDVSTRSQRSSTYATSIETLKEKS